MEDCLLSDLWRENTFTYHHDFNYCFKKIAIPSTFSKGAVHIQYIIQHLFFSLYYFYGTFSQRAKTPVRPNNLNFKQRIFFHGKSHFDSTAAPVTK